SSGLQNHWLGVRVSPPVQRIKIMSKLRTYVEESTDELLNKVSWPTWSELQSSGVVVMIASIIISLIIFLMDTSFSTLMEKIYEII
ncbi:MAG: preprotein translocase subunit SecE, partial [Vicingaceae bacterium]